MEGLAETRFAYEPWKVFLSGGGLESPMRVPETRYVAENDGTAVMVFPGSLTRRKLWDTAGYKRVSRAFEGMCVQEKGDHVFASRN